MESSKWFKKENGVPSRLRLSTFLPSVRSPKSGDFGYFENLVIIAELARVWAFPSNNHPKAPKLSILRLSRWDVLLLLGKLYNVELAGQDKRGT